MDALKKLKEISNVINQLTGELQVVAEDGDELTELDRAKLKAYDMALISLIKNYQREYNSLLSKELGAAENRLNTITGVPTMPDRLNNSRKSST